MVSWIVMTLEEAKAVLAALLQERVDFVVIGSMAMAAQGLPRATHDLDLFVSPEIANLESRRFSIYSTTQTSARSIPTNSQESILQWNTSLPMVDTRWISSPDSVKPSLGKTFSKVATRSNLVRWSCESLAHKCSTV